ncbi:hypothetical protein HU718_016720 [Pseudomonas tensinigenes]|uniref:Uncharacterized protein n=1 Tax=Pseudomonas tensinigenes TaxID=2745511 RepID=A0ABX8PR08_9PSED|nr:hypothetical protein [Pseudomonas tensinigenes]QXI03680.1 hypothetical protein HU718_016720 [Pseudomonas tensinigenes]
MSINGGIKADISLVPQKSQIFVVLFAVASIGCLATGFAFIWFDKAKWELPFWAAIATGLVAFVSWCLSHKNSDMAEGHATKITMNAQEMSVIVDPRTVIPKNLMQHFSNFLVSVSNRAPLPQSSGMIDESGNVIDGSVGEAAIAIRNANDQATRQTEDLVRMFGELPKANPLPTSADVPSPNFTGEDLQQRILSGRADN